MNTLSLVIPSYQRPEQLRHCLASAAAQSHSLLEIVVVIRHDDDRTREALAGRDVRIVEVSEPGVLAAMIAGAAASVGSIIGFSDDDATLSPTWCEQVLSTFDDPANEDVGGLGGRDHIFDGGSARETTLTKDVGRVSFWGRLVGNHHRGLGRVDRVHVLKGVNSAYRRSVLGLPLGLRGDGAQAHYEVAVGAYVRRRGSHLRYDANLTVEHRPAPRSDDDQRVVPSSTAVANSAFNLMRPLSASQQSRRWMYVHVVGDRACPGVLRCVVAALRSDHVTLARRAPSWRATSEAWRLRHDPLEFVTFSPTTH
jgi:glycosyltransferase involved in cell wall biosynthesis